MSFLTVKDVAAEAKLERKKVIRAIAAGELEASNVGGQKNAARYRIDQRSLERWLESRRVTA